MIRLTNVSRTVASGAELLTILQPLDLTVPRGQFVAVVGPSGSGKSTLLSLVAGLDSPSSGQILLNGEDITRMNEDDLADLRGALLGFVFQSFHLIPSLTASRDPEVSVEENLARWLMVEVGDTLVFDLLGQRLDARVTSVRSLDRQARSLASFARFDFLFRPGTLERAPHVFVGALKGPSSRADRARMQNGFVEQFPNVSLVDALDDIEDVRNRVAEAALLVSILGGFVSACGVLILAGSITMTRFQRIYEAAILKTIGARKMVLVKTAVIEYGVLGLLAGSIGSAAAIALTWAVARSSRSGIPWHLQPSINVVGVVLTVFLVTVVGVLASWDVLMKKPLGALRDD